MAFTYTSEYNGDFLQQLYEVLTIGNEIVAKGVVNFQTGIAKQRSLPVLSQTELPFGVYTDDVPASDSVTTTWVERTLVPALMTLFEKFVPRDSFEIWDKWHPQGDMTNLRLNPELIMAVLRLYMNNAGTQISKLFWQGDTSLAASTKLHFFDGIITRALADANVTKISGTGNITTQNALDILLEFWKNIPDKFMDNPNYKIAMNTGDYKTVQEANILAKQTNDGVLEQMRKDLIIGKKIEHFSGMKEDHIIGTLMTPDEVTSNLHMGVYLDMVEGENPVIDKVDNLGKRWGIRVDYKGDANYRYAGDILLSKPN